MQHDKHEAMDQLIAVGVPAGAVFDTMELQTSRASKSAASCRHVHHRDGDDDGRPGRCGSTASPVRLKSAPLLGEHTAEVLADWLGIDAAEIASLRGEGVL